MNAATNDTYLKTARTPCYMQQAGGCGLHHRRRWHGLTPRLWVFDRPVRACGGRIRRLQFRPDGSQGVDDGGYPAKNGERRPRAVQAMEIFDGNPHAVRIEFGTIRYDGRLSDRMTPEAIGQHSSRSSSPSWTAACASSSRRSDDGPSIRSGARASRDAGRREAPRTRNSQTS
jgi:hypothetical protein